MYLFGKILCYVSFIIKIHGDSLRRMVFNLLLGELLKKVNDDVGKGSTSMENVKSCIFYKINKKDLIVKLSSKNQG